MYWDSNSTGQKLCMALGRQSNRVHAKQLLEKLEAVSAANGGARIDIVTHSMGGLLIKFLLAQYPGAFERLVRPALSTSGSACAGQLLHTRISIIQIEAYIVSLFRASSLFIVT